MASDNVELVRGMFDHWSRGEFWAADIYHQDVVFEMVDWPESATARGVEAMAETWRSALGAWDDFHAEPTEYIEADPHVVVMTHVTATGKGSEAKVSADVAALMTFEAGKVRRLALYWDPAKALDEAGVSNMP
jgi:ketosteroid isomerase-like protein